MSCYGCEKRTIGCHATCEDYKEFRAKLDERKRREQSFRNPVYYMRDQGREERERKRKRYG